jgi:hypothetical protein
LDGPKLYARPTSPHPVGPTTSSRTRNQFQSPPGGPHGQCLAPPLACTWARATSPPPHPVNHDVGSCRCRPHWAVAAALPIKPELHVASPFCVPQPIEATTGSSRDREWERERERAEDRAATNSIPIFDWKQGAWVEFGGLWRCW